MVISKIVWELGCYNLNKWNGCEWENFYLRVKLILWNFVVIFVGFWLLFY